MKTVGLFVTALMFTVASSASAFTSFAVQGSTTITKTVSGRTTTSPLSGVTVSFALAPGTPSGTPLPKPATTNAQGVYNQSGFKNGVTYIARPSKSGVSFNPNSRSFTAGSNSNIVTGIQFAGR